MSAQESNRGWHPLTRRQFLKAPGVITGTLVLSKGWDSSQTSAVKKRSKLNHDLGSRQYKGFTREVYGLTAAYQQIGITMIRTHDYYGPLDMATMYLIRTLTRPTPLRTTSPRYFSPTSGLGMLAGQNSEGEIALLMANPTATATSWSLAFSDGRNISDYKLTVKTVSDASAEIATSTPEGNIIAIGAYSVQLVIIKR